ncbi:uncharacterized protein EAE98_001332 [Botrytis deweyae]|uniref:Uncharacterized protein n=1 Tax=Botrytis deweyae TaxID=2478750 RepID=A0ABQ7J164_9HELO|nr:uncharacterized protein EAE98_001332 [Botrytis deweyae]KAF7938996.1 hypothetical protein EAE98_001332 [Botrytis deweyae]
MSDQASVNRSISTIRTELELLSQNSLLSPSQFQSIMAQLPQKNGSPSQYIDTRYNSSSNFNPQQMAQEAQDPNHPAHPVNRKQHEWAKVMTVKLEIAAVLGAVLAVLVYSIITE